MHVSPIEIPGLRKGDRGREGHRPVTDHRQQEQQGQQGGETLLATPQFATHQKRRNQEILPLNCKNSSSWCFETH